MAIEQTNGGHTESPVGDQDVDNQLSMLQARFTNRLSASEWDGVRTALVKQRARAAKLRAVPLENRDEPATLLRLENDRD